MSRRQNPDQLLKAIQDEEVNQNKGHLKIFFGYAAGVGKTYAAKRLAYSMMGVKDIERVMMVQFLSKPTNLE